MLISVILEVFRDLVRAIKRDQPLGVRKETDLEVWRRNDERNPSIIIIYSKYFAPDYYTQATDGFIRFLEYFSANNYEY